MTQTLRFGFCASLLLSIVSATATQAFASLESDVLAEEAHPTSLISGDLDKVENTQFIMVDGTFGDYYKTNFLPAQALIENEWHSNDVTIIRPYTPNAISDNAEILYGEITTLRKASSAQNAVIISHSKGSAEILLMVLRHPDIVTHFGVSTLDLVSGPMQGTDLVDFVTKDCATLLIPVCAYLQDRLPMVESFLPANIIPLMQDAADKLSPSDLQALEQAIFYIRTQMTDTNFKSGLWVPHMYMNIHDHSAGPNDGLIPTANEKMIYDGNVLGTDMGIMQGDHNSLLNNSSNAKVLAYRKAFFRVIIKESYLGNK